MDRLGVEFPLRLVDGTGDAERLRRHGRLQARHSHSGDRHRIRPVEDAQGLVEPIARREIDVLVSAEPVLLPRLLLRDRRSSFHPPRMSPRASASNSRA